MGIIPVNTLNPDDPASPPLNLQLRHPIRWLLGGFRWVPTQESMPGVILVRGLLRYFLRHCLPDNPFTTTALGGRQSRMNRRMQLGEALAEKVDPRSHTLLAS